eukprot:gene13192-27904_t
MATTTASGFLCEEFADTFIKFDDATIGLCSKIMKGVLQIKKFSMELRNNWVNNNIIEADATYEEVAGNGKLMKTLLKYLGHGLSTDVNDSMYGNGILDDFKIYFNCSGNAALSKVIAPFNLQHSEVVKLQKRRDALFAFVRKIRLDILDNMDLVGAPDRTSHKAKPKPLKTREDVANDISLQEQSVRNDNIIREPNNTTIKKHKSFNTKLIERYPTILTQGVFLYFDSEQDRIVVPPIDLMMKFSNEFFDTFV